MAGGPEIKVTFAEIQQASSDITNSANTVEQHLSDLKGRIAPIVADWTGIYQYTIDQVLDDIIKRCRELRLRLTRSTELTTLESIVMVTVQTMNYLHGGHHRVAL